MAPREPADASGEDRLIARHFKPLAGDPRALGLIDDCAVMTPPAGCDLVLKTDAIVGGVHFLPDDPAETVGKKALRVNLSDLAAKGAVPSGFLLTLALPADMSEDWLAELARGLGEDAQAFGCPLLGGDTVRTSGPVMISVAIIGTVPGGTMVTRMGAKIGDRVVVTGTIGDAALGLRLLRDPAAEQSWALDTALRDHLVARYRVPQPRNALAEAVRTHAAGAMDVSDGLVGDLGKLCAASGVSAEIAVRDVPFSPAAERALARDPGLRELLLTGGDDYEILCALPAPRLEAFRSAASAADVPVTVIGRIVAGAAPPRFVDHDGRPLDFVRRAFSHF
jgi:thiamine-monophosphate kinase